MFFDLVFSRRTATMVASMLAIMLPFFNRADASTLQLLHSFCRLNYCADGGPSYTRPLVAQNGDIYGTNFALGPYGQSTGAVFQLHKTATGYVYKIIHAFCQDGPGCPDGAWPTQLIMAQDGSLFGLATGGGGAGAFYGTVFVLSPNATHTSWTFTKIYDFEESYQTCGCYIPSDITYAGEAAGALYDGASPLFVTTSKGGGLNNGYFDPGTVAKLTRDQNGVWSGKTLYAFCSIATCLDGADPRTLIAASPGRLYGVADAGGDCNGQTGFSGCGLIFEVFFAHGSWHERVLYTFCAPGYCSITLTGGRLVLRNGWLYGTSTYGGDAENGTIFRIPASGTPTPQILHTFCCRKGASPSGGIVFDSSGALLGTTVGGGAYGWGTIYRRDAGHFSVLYSFCPTSPKCTDGRQPETGVALDAKGNVFGLTAAGGKFDMGDVFQLVP